MNKRAKTMLIIILIILIAMLLKSLNVENIILQRLYPITYSEYVYNCSEQNDIDPLLIFSIIKGHRHVVI